MGLRINHPMPRAVPRTGQGAEHDGGNSNAVEDWIESSHEVELGKQVLEILCVYGMK